MTGHIIYQPIHIIHTLINDFIPTRSTIIKTGKNYVDYTDDDKIRFSMEHANYARIDTKLNKPRGQRDLCIFIILSPDGEPANHAPDLKPILDGIIDNSTIISSLCELNIIVEEHFLGRKSVCDVVRNRQLFNDSIDAEGLHYFVNLYVYDKFVCNILTNDNVPPHRILSQEEETQVLSDLHCAKSSLPIIFMDDSPIIWIGARPGQVIEIERRSDTSGKSKYYRRVENN